MTAGRGAACAAAILVAVLTVPAQSQQFTPRERDLLFQPTHIGPSPGGFERKGTEKPGDKRAGAAQPKSAKTKSDKSTIPGRAGVSISSELNAPSQSGTTSPALRRAGESASQPQKPWDQRVPFGPLSLGLQADTSPRSDALTTPVPSGMEQFKKDRVEPYVGVSIIDIKR